MCSVSGGVHKAHCVYCLETIFVSGGLNEVELVVGCLLNCSTICICEHKMAFTENSQQDYNTEWKPLKNRNLHFLHRPSTIDDGIFGIHFMYNNVRYDFELNVFDSRNANRIRSKCWYIRMGSKTELCSWIIFIRNAFIVMVTGNAR